MRNKLKKIWNKEDGFTLVELLGVIVILGLIIAIAVPALGNIMSKAEDNTKKAQEELVIDAAQLYFIENPKEKSVTVTDLISDGFLEDKGNLKGAATVTLTGGKYTVPDDLIVKPATP